MALNRIGARFLVLSNALVTSVSLLALTSVSAFGQQQVQLDEVVVEGGKKTPATGTVGQPPSPYAGEQVATGARVGVLGNRPILETPFNIVSYTEELVRDQMARTIGEVASNDSSVRNDAPIYSERDSFMIRGFSVTNLDTAYDGLFYLTNARRHFVEGVERVDVLKGPTALLNGGLGRVGGTINLVPKRAADEPLTRLTTGYMSDSQVWSHIDLGRRYGPEGEWGVRVNGSYRFGETPLDHNEAKVGVGSLGLDYRGDRLRASFDLNYSNQKLDAPTSLFNYALPGINIPGAPNGRINTANPFEYVNSVYEMAAARVEYDIFDNTTIYAAGGASRYRENTLTSYYEIFDDRGNATAYLETYPQMIKGFSGEVGLRSQFNTGPVGHQLTISATQALNENYRGGFEPSDYPAEDWQTNIFNPSALLSSKLAQQTLPRADDRPLFAELVATSVAVSDTLSFFDDRFQLTVGGRFQDLRSEAFNIRPVRGPIGERNYFYQESRFSPAVAGLVRVTDKLSVYANYIEALTEGEISPSGDVVLPPTVNSQIEAGLKYDFGTFGVTASVFEIEEPSIYTSNGVFAANGLQVNRGVELSVFGEPVDGVRLLGGVTVLDATLEKTEDRNADGKGDFDGKDAPGVSDLVLKLYGEYDAPWIAEGLTLTGRVSYSGETYFDRANTQKIDDWAVVDIGLRYEHTRSNGKPIVLRAGINNVFDENYWASSARSFLSAGAPRNFSLSASFDF